MLLNVLRWFNIALRPRKPEGSLGRTAQDGHLDSHTAPELCIVCHTESLFISGCEGLHHSSHQASLPLGVRGMTSCVTQSLFT